jgi:NDP-sugar pyrophosphorylase family protein
MQAVILAAGRGSRLHPLTLRRSKAMMPVAGQPMVARVMETLIENGLHDFIMVVSPDDDELRRYFSGEHRPGVKLTFAVQVKRLGMAHALSQARPHLHETFVLSACDNLTSTEHVADLLKTHQRAQAGATLSLMEIDRSLTTRSGIVDLEHDRIRRIVEKPQPAEAPSNIASLPLYVFSPQLLDYLPGVQLSPRGEYELQDAIQDLIDDNALVSGVFAPSRMQLTNATDLLNLNRHYLLTANHHQHITPASIGSNTRLIPPVRIEAGTIIGPGCTIGPGVYVEGNCQIGTNVLLRDAVVLRHTAIAGGREIVGQVVGPPEGVT